MTNEVVKRVARAICAGVGLNPDGKHRGAAGMEYAHWEAYTSIAIAAIKAMREPSEEMTEAGIERAVLWDSRDDRGMVVNDTYEGMIDAALKDKPDGS